MLCGILSLIATVEDSSLSVTLHVFFSHYFSSCLKGFISSPVPQIVKK